MEKVSISYRDRVFIRYRVLKIINFKSFRSFFLTFYNLRSFKLPAMLIGVDVARHKEIATKALSGFLLLLLKHLKVNHIHQFEYVTHHLYISNCVPLIVKIFNQSMPMFVTQRNQIPLLDFRRAVRGKTF